MMNIKYTLEGIYELLFEVKGDNCGDISEISYRAQTEIDLNKSQVSVIPMVRYGNRSGIFMEYGCRMVYNIPGLCDLVTYRQEDEKIEFAVDIMPVLWPAAFSMFQIIKQVVVLPFVPVTPITRSFLPGWPYLTLAATA